MFMVKDVALHGALIGLGVFVVTAALISGDHGTATIAGLAFAVLGVAGLLRLWRQRERVARARLVRSHSGLSRDPRR